MHEQILRLSYLFRCCSSNVTFIISFCNFVQEFNIVQAKIPEARAACRPCAFASSSKERGTKRPPVVSEKWKAAFPKASFSCRPSGPSPCSRDSRCHKDNPMPQPVPPMCTVIADGATLNFLCYVLLHWSSWLHLKSILLYVWYISLLEFLFC